MEPGFVEVRGLRVHCLVAGDGPAMVLLPGLLDWAGRWAEFGYIESFAKDFRVVAVDTLGVGTATTPAIQPTRLPEPHRAGGWRDGRLTVDSAHVWGYSAGGQLAAAFAQAHPARVRSLTAGGGVPVVLKSDPAQFEAQAAALLAGGWDEYWSLAGSPVPASSAAYRAAVEPHNNPPVFAARLRGMAIPFEPGRPIPGPEALLRRRPRTVGRAGARGDGAPRRTLRGDSRCGPRRRVPEPRRPPSRSCATSSRALTRSGPRERRGARRSRQAPPRSPGSRRVGGSAPRQVLRAVLAAEEPVEEAALLTAGGVGLPRRWRHRRQRSNQPRRPPSPGHSRA